MMLLAHFIAINTASYYTTVPISTLSTLIKFIVMKRAWIEACGGSKSVNVFKSMQKRQSAEDGSEN